MLNSKINKMKQNPIKRYRFKTVYYFGHLDRYFEVKYRFINERAL